MTQSTFAEQSVAFIFQVFFSTVKVVFVVVLLMAIVLIAGQNSSAPVSVRLLTSYGMEYAVAKLKPYRPLFPEPYLIHVETN